jgi:hypothetical protein
MTAPDLVENGKQIRVRYEFLAGRTLAGRDIAQRVHLACDLIFAYRSIFETFQNGQ